jgi:protein TonB
MRLNGMLKAMVSWWRDLVFVAGAAGALLALAGCGAARASARDCSDALHKAKLMSLPQDLGYTPEARASRVEGRVRLAVEVDASGHVTDVRVRDGLGYGLDEAATKFARSLRFEPATRCGSPVPSEFTMSLRFILDPPPAG